MESVWKSIGEKFQRNMIRKAKRNFERKIADGSAKDGISKRKFFT